MSRADVVSAADAAMDRDAFDHGAPLGQDATTQARRLLEVLPVARGARLLDLACADGATSRALARDAGVTVVALDREPAFLARTQAHTRVLPVAGDARALPFAPGSFDAAVAIDSWHYFGTDERWLIDLLAFLAPGGLLGVVDIGFAREIDDAASAPAFLAGTFAEHWSFVHAPETWQARWERSGAVEVLDASVLPESRELLRGYARARRARGEPDEITRAFEEDDEGLLVLFRIAARKR